MESYEWKMKSVLGLEDPTYQTQLARTGWEAVPTDRHPDMMPLGDKYPIIERKGMVLMERPKIISDRIRERDKKKAREQVRAKEAQLSATPEGQFDRNADDRTRPRIKKSFEALEVPE